MRGVAWSASSSPERTALASEVRRAGVFFLFVMSSWWRIALVLLGRAQPMLGQEEEHAGLARALLWSTFE